MSTTTRELVEKCKRLVDEFGEVVAHADDVSVLTRVEQARSAAHAAIEELAMWQEGSALEAPAPQGVQAGLTDERVGQLQYRGNTVSGMRK